MRKYRSIYIAHQLERTKIIFYYRIIINNVVLTHIFANHFAQVSQLLQKTACRSALYFAVVSFFTFYISSHIAFVSHLLRAHSNYHQYSSDRLHERILSLFTLSYYLFACVMCGIIYKKDIFDEVIDSLCTQNAHHHTLCIVHERIYTRLIYHLLLWIYSCCIQTFSCSFSSNV